MRPNLKIVAPVVVLALAGGWYAVSHKSAKPVAMAAKPRLVKVESVHLGPFYDRVEAIGTLTANESVTLTAKSQGIVRSIAFDDSQIVKKGEEIATIDAGEQNAALKVEQATLAQQQKELARTLQLLKERHVSEAKVDELMAGVSKAEANVAAAGVRASDRRIVAPFSGILGTRRISVGALVSPGTAVVTLDDISVMKLDFAVPETFMGSLKAGLAIEATASAYPGEVFKGVVASLDSRVDPVTRAITVRAIIPNPDLRLRPGMLMVADLIKDQRESLVISEASLQPENDQQYVYTVDANGIANRVKITIGARRVGSVEVLDGLTEGAIVIREGNQDLRPGAKVTIANPEALSGPRAGQPAAASGIGPSQG